MLSVIYPLFSRTATLCNAPHGFHHTADRLFVRWVRRPSGRTGFRHLATLHSMTQPPPRTRCLAHLSSPCRGRTRSPYSSISYRQCEDLIHCPPQLSADCRIARHPDYSSGPYQPEDPIKVERRSRTLRDHFLANLDPKRRFLLEDCPALIDSGRRLLIK